MKYYLFVLALLLLTCSLKGQERDNSSSPSEYEERIVHEAENLKDAGSKLDTLNNFPVQEKLEEIIPDLKYDSENPDDAPWKKHQFRRDQLKDINAPDIQGILTPVDEKQEYTERLKNLKPKVTGANQMVEEGSKSIQELKQHPRTKKISHSLDSLLKVKDDLEVSSLQEAILGATRVHSEKFIRKIYDSVGVKKADSIFKVATSFSKKETGREELLRKINGDLEENSGLPGMALDEQTGGLKMADADRINALPDEIANTDLSKLQLPQEVLGELPPLPGIKVDSKYLPVIDSMRDVYMDARRMRIKENEITEELKQASLKYKPSFWDKSYFEGILGYVNDSTLSIVQISPALGYHFTDNFSLGFGPTVSVEWQQKGLNAVVGFRSFVKNEFFKQRGYLQIEDNVQPSRFDIERIKTTRHDILAGGGAVLPLSSKLAINIAVFYRVNQSESKHDGSPWVFRIGLSSVKDINKN